ncbi:hypothetical protein Pla175_13860 [Pirellulimonas nuda]|uniref:Uncharacterized protein n=1 Tax=Pirellulimonas nuda TaxID=2528009 RepID=A0A518D971_9BACT|nr:hypothetical protein [Pirellulimonas nuda]QDU88017.1 hypothetical protein Pla175_13860 [Pirellulimonas nuda]
MSQSTATAPRGVAPASHTMEPAQDLAAYLKTYAKDHPDVAALWCFGIGFIIGWKLKPW